MWIVLTPWSEVFVGLRYLVVIWNGWQKEVKGWNEIMGGGF